MRFTPPLPALPMPRLAGRCSGMLRMADLCLDIQSSTALTHLTVPKLVLDGRHRLLLGGAVHSAPTERPRSGRIMSTFATAATDADTNANGIPDVQEVASSVDLDKDGVKDNQQTPSSRSRWRAPRSRSVSVSRIVLRRLPWSPSNPKIHGSRTRMLPASLGECPSG